MAEELTTHTIVHQKFLVPVCPTRRISTLVHRYVSTITQPPATVTARYASHTADLPACSPITDLEAAAGGVRAHVVVVLGVRIDAVDDDEVEEAVVDRFPEDLVQRGAVGVLQLRVELIVHHLDRTQTGVWLSQLTDNNIHCSRGAISFREQ